MASLEATGEELSAVKDLIVLSKVLAKQQSKALQTLAGLKQFHQNLLLIQALEISISILSVKDTQKVKSEDPFD